MVGSRETVTLNEQLPVRLSESVAVHVTSVLPIGKFCPESGEQATVTEPSPPVTAGASNVTAKPPAFTVEREMPSRQLSVGAFATGGGGGGGGGVGVTGVLLHDAISITLAMTKPNDARFPECDTLLIDVNY